MRKCNQLGRKVNLFGPTSTAFLSEKKHDAGSLELGTMEGRFLEVFILPHLCPRCMYDM